MPYIGKSPVGGGFHKLDNLTASATATYALTLGGAAYYPETANQLLVSLNGVIQAPQDSFTVSGSNLIFDTALTASDSIDFVVALGDVLGVGSVSDGAITTAKIGNGAVTSAKLDTNIAVSGDLTVDTNTLYVDSTNNRVGVGDASPPTELGLGSGTFTIKNASTDSNGLKIYQAASDTSTIMNHYGGAMVFGTNNAERLRISSSGKVGISQTNPDSESLVDLGSGENAGHTRKLLVTNTGNSRAGLGALSNIFRVFYADDQNLQFGTISRDGNFTFSEKMRIAANGATSFYGTNQNNKIVFEVSNTDRYVTHNIDTSNGSGFTYNVFLRGGSTVGTITFNGTGVNYNTTSDYRLKENVVADWDATTRLKQLNPVRFNFIADADTTVDGFLAHEVQDVVPEAISGTKDAVDDEGNAVYQGIDQSKLVPLLVKTIQELEARITALEAN